TPNDTQTAINAAAGPTCTASSLQTGNSIGSNNGMAQPVMNTLETVFTQKYNASGTVTVKDSSGNTTYSGTGWKVYIPGIHAASCPAQAINGAQTIVGWTEFVMTQVINKGDCAVQNHYLNGNNPWDPIGKAPNCNGTNTPSNSGALRAVFGYYSCNLYQAN